jgi:hypothetical protein
MFPVADPLADVFSDLDDTAGSFLTGDGASLNRADAP